MKANVRACLAELLSSGITVEPELRGRWMELQLNYTRIICIIKLLAYMHMYIFAYSQGL